MQQLTAIKHGVSELWSGGRGKILITIAAGWGLSMGVRMVYPILLPYIRETYDLNLATAGLLLTVLFLAYALGQLPGGVLADRLGERIVLIASMLLSAGTLALVVTTISAPLLFISTALFGASLALFAIARYTTLTALYPDHLGAANGVASAAADGGQSMLPPVGGLIAVVLAWQYGFGFAIPLFLLVAVALWKIIPTRLTKSGRAVDSLSVGSARNVLVRLRRPSIARGTAVFTLGICIWQAFTGFYPTYLIEVKHISSTFTSVLFGLFFGLGVLIKPFAGGAYDRFGARRTLLIIMGISGAALAILPTVDQLWTLAAVTALISTLLGFTTVTESYLLTMLPETIRGTGFGVLRAIAFSAGSVSPVLFGTAADQGFFDEAFFVLAVFAGAMIIIILWLPES